MSISSPWVKFWPAWVLANTFGWMAYNIVFILPFFRSLAGLCIGFLIAALQWAVLSQYIDVDMMWPWVSVLPYGLLLFVITLLGDKLSYLALFFVEALILGAFGYIQSSILRNYVNFALIWVVASPLAAIIGTMTARAADQILFPRADGPSVLFWALMGLIYGGITGIVLIFLNNSEDI
jgi:hypothetical protein